MEGARAIKQDTPARTDQDRVWNRSQMEGRRCTTFRVKRHRIGQGGVRELPYHGYGVSLKVDRDDIDSERVECSPGADDNRDLFQAGCAHD